MIIGLLTETNQFIPINEPIKYFENNILKEDDKSYKKNIEQYNHFDADKVILTSLKKDEERESYIKKIKLETMFYTSFRNLIKILLNKYENQSYRNEIQSLIYKKTHLFYHEKLEMLVNTLKKLTNDQVEFSNYDESVLNEIENITLCFENCEKPYCLQTDSGNCKFIIPESNLISENTNLDLYYSKVVDELLRHYRLREYILEYGNYLSFSKIIYNISENELILPQSFLNKNILIH